MNRLAIVLRREIGLRITRPSFAVSTLMSILIMSGIALLPQLRTGNASALKMTVHCLAPAPCADVSQLFREQNFRMVDAESDADVVVDMQAVSKILRVRVREEKPLGKRIDNQIRGAISAAVISKDGLIDYSLIQVKSAKLQISRELALSLIVLLYLGVQTYGLVVASSVVEEKNSRTADLLLSAVKPSVLLWGKLLGIGIVGLLQSCLVIGGAAGVIAASLPFVPQLIASSGGASMILPDGTTVGLMLLFFVLGYFSYGAIFAVLGAIMPDPERVRQYALVLYLPLYAAFYMAISVTNFGVVERIMSEIPLLSPMIMFSRLTSNDASALEVTVAVVLNVAFIASVITLGTRLYSVESLVGEARRPFVGRRASQ